MKTRREKNRKRRTIRRVFKKILHSRTSRIKKDEKESRDWKGGVKLEEKEEDEDKRKKKKARLKEEKYEMTTGIVFKSCLHCSLYI